MGTAHQEMFKEGVVSNNRHLHFIHTYRAKDILDNKSITYL